MGIKRKVFLSIFLILISASIYAQTKEGALWYFGNQSSVSFKSGQPISDFQNSLSSNNSISSISDEEGNLLFYTDGIQVINKNHQVMPNGSGLKTARITTIFKQPNKEDIYFIFGITDAGEMWLTVVDLSLDNGNGDIATNSKNITIYPEGIAPKLSLVLHSNANDIWVITHENSTNRYISFLVTSTGISITNIVPLGRSYCNRTVSNCGTLGMMKAAPNGAIIADPLPVFSEIQLVSFDKTSGFFRNPITLETELTLIGEKRSVGFSPNSRYVYEGSDEIISQYDLDAGDELQVRSSKLLLADVSRGNSSNTIIDFQLGLDGKLYFLTKGTSDQLGVISCPNVRGGNSNIQTGVMSFTNAVGNIDGFAPQPNFFFQNTALQLSASATKICLGDTVQLSAFGGGIENFSWLPTESLTDDSILNPKAIPTETTTYTLTASDLCGNNFTRNVTVEVTSLEALSATSNSPVNAGNDISLEASGLTLPNVTYEWFGPTNFTSTEQSPQLPNVTFDNAGTYKVVATSAEGCISDTVLVDVKVIGEIEILEIKDRRDELLNTFCPGQEIKVTYKVNPTTPFEGEIQLSDKDGDFSTPVIIDSPFPVFNNTSSNEETLTITLPSAIENGINYKLRIFPNADSLYTLINDISFEINQLTTQTSADTTLCNISAFTLNATPLLENEIGYWEVIKGNAVLETDSTQATANVTELTEGENVFIWNLIRGSCEVQDSLTVTLRLAKAELENQENQILCEGDSITLTVNSNDSNTIQWFRDNELLLNETNSELIVNTSGKFYALASSTENCSDTTSIIEIKTIPRPTISIQAPDTVRICPGENFALTADTSNVSSIQWFFNNEISVIDTTNSINITQEGAYQAVVSNSVCTDSSKVVFLEIAPIQAPSLNVGDTLLFCEGTIAQVQADTIPGYTYQWQRNKVDIVGATSPLLTTTTSQGDYRLVVFTNLCSDTSRTIRVERIPPLELNYPDSIAICSEEMYSPPEVLQGSLLTYLWSPQMGIDTLTKQSPSFSLSVTQDSTVEYFVSVVNSMTKCVVFDTLKVTYLTKPIANTGGDTLSLCQGDSIQIGTSPLPNLLYKWNRSSFLSDSTAANPIFYSDSIINLSQVYFLQVTDTVTNCTSNDTLYLNIIPTIELNLEESYRFCSGDTIKIGSTQQIGVQYQWFSSDPTIPLPNQAEINLSIQNQSVAPDTLQLVLKAQTETCSRFDTTQVIVFPKPLIGKLTGDIILCNNQLEASYNLDNQAGVPIEWKIEGGEIISSNDSLVNILWYAKAVTNVISAQPISLFDCFLDAQKLEIRIVDTPQPKISSFKNELCRSEQTQTYSVENFTSGSTYQWFFEGATILEGEANENVIVNWEENEGRFWLLETHENSCLASTDTFNLTIFEIPQISTSQPTITLCESNLTDQVYSVETSSNTNLNWELSGGAIIDGQGTNEIRVNWEENTSKSLQVSAQSEQSCLSDTIQFLISTDSFRPSINFVTVQNQDILIEIDLSDKIKTLQRSIDALTWTEVSTLSNNISSYTDTEVDVNSNAYYYRLYAVNSCSDTVFSESYRTIHLIGNSNSGDNTISLNWNSYQGSDILAYQLFQKTENGSFENITEVSQNQSEFIIASVPFATEVCYEIRASLENLSEVSFSNQVCFTFNTELVIPNVFTPNNDGFNDTWEIQNIPPNTFYRLEVVNRWGKIIFKSDDSSKSWNGSNIPSGTYFYRLTIGDEVYRNWIKVLK